LIGGLIGSVNGLPPDLSLQKYQLKKSRVIAKTVLAETGSLSDFWC
jgi:hypothetical protein